MASSLAKIVLISIVIYSIADCRPSRRRPSFHLSIQKPQSSSLTNFEENSSTNYRSQDEKFLTAQNRNFGGAGDFEEEMMDFEPSYLVENLSSICPECVQKANNIIRP